MAVVIAYFASERYVTRDLLTSTAAALGDLGIPGAHVAIIASEADLAALSGGADSMLVVVPLSGAIQALILTAAERFAHVAVCSSYVESFTGGELRKTLLRANAAPCVMDVYAVLKRRPDGAALCQSPAEARRAARVFTVRHRLRAKRVLLIGETEPWVVSASRDHGLYHDRFGVEVVCAPQSDVIRVYEALRGQDDAMTEDFLDYARGASACLEPTEEDLHNAARMARVLLNLLGEYSADAVAIACFDLLRTGTTACLGVSYINDRTGKSAACEGDLDSAVTMLMMRELTDGRLWMANPALCEDGRILYSHCTAPLHMGDTPCPFTLRSHHESGIGVSLQVELPPDRRVTICRASAVTGCVAISGGVTSSGPYEPCCRTQIYVTPDDFAQYLATTQGCHQVLVYGDIAEDMRALSAVMGLSAV